jgi:hypothetical protein
MTYFIIRYTLIMTYYKQMVTFVDGGRYQPNYTELVTILSYSSNSGSNLYVCWFKKKLYKPWAKWLRSVVHREATPQPLVVNGVQSNQFV